MKTLARICFGFSLVTFALAAVAQGPNGEAFSENRKFSAEISTARLDKPLLSVFRHENEAKVHVWTRALEDKETEEDVFSSRIPFDVNWFRVLVSDDGKTVILRSRYPQPEVPALRILRQGGGDKSYELDDLRELLTDDGEHWNGPRCFEFFLETETPPVYAMWFPPEAEWIVIDLEQLTLRKANTAAAKALDEAALPRAREIARKSRPSGLQKLLRPLVERAAEFIPALGGPNQPRSSFYEGPEAAYRFLASKKNPGDRRLIEELLEAELQKSISWGPGPEGRPFVSTGLTSRERAIADELLTKWDGKEGAETEEEDSDATTAFSGKKGKMLSAIFGQVNLPFGAPTNAGSIWIYLIPGRVSQGKWAGDASVRKLRYDPADYLRMMGPMMGREPEPMDDVSFFFSTLDPGEYRVKAVWDRRPPNAPRNDEAICIPEAGDYESAESETLKLAAGEQISGVILNCTNRVGEAEEFFAADDLWQKQYPASREPERPRKRTVQKVLAGGPVHDWLLKTNENSASVTLKRIQLLEFTTGGEVASRQFQVSFRMPGGKRDEMPNLKGKLMDEHGCVFEGYGHRQNGSRYEMIFSLFPYAAREMVLSLSREDYQDEKGRPFRDGMQETKLATFTLTNLSALKPAEWKADPERPRRDLDIVSVELTSFDPQVGEFMGPPGFMGPGGRPYQPRQNKFTFTANGKPAPGWQKIQGRYKDRWGNVSPSAASFCKEEEVLKYTVSFMRDPVKGSFSAEERLEIPVKQIPGAGESVPLGVRKQVQGLEFEVVSVGGTGEFTYRNGQFISAAPEIDEEGAPVAVGPGYGPQFPADFHGRPVQPKMYLKVSEPRQPGFDWMRRQSGKGQVTIATKIPHVVCRVPQPESDTKFALVEQDISVPDPLDSRPGMNYGGPPPAYHSVQFLPLEYRAGDSDRKLTFVVQKTRTAEFFVRVPRGSIRADQPRF